MYAYMQTCVDYNMRHSILLSTEMGLRNEISLISFINSLFLPILLLSYVAVFHIAFLTLSQRSVLQIRRSKRNNYGIIFHITPLKHLLQHIIRTISPRWFY